MTVNTIVLGEMFGANCHLIESDNAAVVVDPAEYSDQVFAFLNTNADKERLILLTHCHLDHICGADALREKTGVKIAIGEYDAIGTLDTRISLSDLFGGNHQPFEVDIKLSDGQRFTVGDLEFEAIHTAGHTVGGMCYAVCDCLFSGDTLFAGTVGRTDFFGGDGGALMESLRMLTEKFDDGVTVYAGHGPDTTIGREKRVNPYLRRYETL